MKHSLIFLALIVLISCGGQESNKDKYDISFQRENDVCVQRFADGKVLKFKDGFDPAISPDGNKLAYTKSKDFEEGFIRYIVVVDLKTNQETKLNVNNDNYYGASWSPDNSLIAFNIFVENNWSVGLINSDNTGFKLIKANSDMGLFEPTWSSDSKHIIAHNMQKIYKFDLGGDVVDSIDISREIGENYYTSSASKFLFTSDNRYLVFNCDTDEIMEDVDGPVSALFVYDTKNKATTRLSPKGMFAFDPNLKSDNSVIFCGFKEKTYNIYSVDLITKKIELIIKDATRPTISKK